MMGVVPVVMRAGVPVLLKAATSQIRARIGDRCAE